MKTVAQVMQETEGPWHSGFVVDCEVMGHYVSVLCADPDVAAAVALHLGATPTQPQRGMVSRIKEDRDETPPRRR